MKPVLFSLFLGFASTAVAFDKSQGILWDAMEVPTDRSRSSIQRNPRLDLFPSTLAQDEIRDRVYRALRFVKQGANGAAERTLYHLYQDLQLEIPTDAQCSQ